MVITVADGLKYLRHISPANVASITFNVSSKLTLFNGKGMEGLAIHASISCPKEAINAVAKAVMALRPASFQFHVNFSDVVISFILLFFN